MKNAFVFEREPLKNLAHKLPQRLRGACLSIMRYLILEANHSPGWWDGKQLQRGQIFTGRNRLHQETGLSPRTVRSSIALLQKLAEVTSEATSEGTFYVIVNYDSYDGLSEKVTSEATNDRPTTDQRPTTSKEEYKRRNKETTETEGVKDTPSVSRLVRRSDRYQASPEAQTALVEWEKLAPLPTTTSRESCLKTFDDLHRIDGLSWERIGRICEYACKERYPTFLKSPVKLRTLTKNGKIATWEDIELNHQSHEPPRKPDEIDRIIARAHAKKAPQQAGNSEQDHP